MQPSFPRRVLTGCALACLALLAACDNPGGSDGPAPPRNVTVQAQTANTVRLTWTAVSGATEYVVQRASTGADYAEVGRPAGTTFDDAGLAPNTDYSYRIASVIGGAATGFGTAVSVTTKAAGGAQVTLEGNLTSSRTLYADTVYVLRGYVKVRAGATLTIQPGTTIVGDTTALGSSLWITRGGRIDARGTAAAPIVFTSQRAAGNRKPGDWGGIILVGRAYVNRSVSGGVAEIFTEGPAGSGQNTAENYGGGTDGNDDSGVMRYVRVEFAGYAVQQNEELNTFSFYAVGRGTRLEYLQALSGLDDSFEWFGGSVDGRYLVSYEAGDDHFDWTEGYSGRNQFLIALQTWQPVPQTSAGTVASDPRGFEGDGCEVAATKPGCGSYTQSPLSMPVFANFTVIGTGPGVFPGSIGLQANGATLRRGTGGTFVNGVIARWQNVGLNVRDAATDQMRALDSLTIANVVLAENGAGNYDPADACTATGSGGSCGVAARYPGTTALAVGTSTLFTTLPAPGTLPTTATLDWTPAGALATAGTTAFSARVAARTASFFGGAMQGTPYAGAAPTTGADLRWWAGWTRYERGKTP